MQSSLLNLLLAACVFVALTALSDCQILPKFSGVHTRDFRTNELDASQVLTDSTDRSSLLRPKLLFPTSDLKGNSVTFRLHVQPSKLEPADEQEVSTPAAAVPVEDAEQLLNRVRGVLRRGERYQSADRLESYKNAVRDIASLATTPHSLSLVLDQALAALLNKLAMALARQGARREALAALSLSLIFFDRSVRGRETSEDSIRRARLMFNMGTVALQDENFSAALLFFHDVLLKLVGGHDPADSSAVALVAGTYARLGGVYLALDDIPQAVFHFREGSAALRGIYDVAAATSAADMAARARSVETFFASPLSRRPHDASLRPKEAINSKYTNSSTVPAPATCQEPSSNSSLSSMEWVRQAVVAVIALLVIASGLLALVPARDATKLPEPSSISITPLRAASHTPAGSKLKGRRRAPVGSADARTPEPSVKKNVNQIERLSAEDEAIFCATETRVLDLLRDGEYTGAEAILLQTLDDRFGQTDGASAEKAQAAIGVQECRLRYMLFKAKVGLEKYQEGEHELMRSIDSYLRLGVIDDVTVAALLDYSLAVIREQLYDENGNEKFTPDRFVRAHNVFCSLLFCPSSVTGKCLPLQRFQMSGPVDDLSVHSFGLLSPGVQIMSMSAASPMFKSPLRAQLTPRDMILVPGQEIKYGSDNDMLKSLERLFYQSRRRKDELGTLALMCAEFEGLAEEMDRCLQLDDFAIAHTETNHDDFVVIDERDAVYEAAVVEKNAAVNTTIDNLVAVELPECPNTDAIATQLGSTTGNGFDEDTFDDLLVGQVEEGDVSSVNFVKLQQSPQNHFGSPYYSGANDSASFESPPYLHMRNGMACNGSEMKENNNCVSLASTDGYLTDSSNWADIVRGTAGTKRKSKHIASPPFKPTSSPSRNMKPKPIR